MEGAELKAFFEQTSQTSGRPQHRFTKNEPRTALSDFSEALAQKNQVPERETLEKASKDHKERAEESTQDVKMTLWKESEQKRSREHTTERSVGQQMERSAFRRGQCVNQTQLWEEALTKPSARLEPERVCISEQKLSLGDTSMRVCEDKEEQKYRELGAKPKQRLQSCVKPKIPKDHLWKEQYAGLEVEQRQLLEENKALDEDYKNLCKIERKEKECAAIKWEIAELKSRKSAVLDEIERAKCRLTRQEASRDRYFDLEDVKCQLLTETKSLDEELVKLKEQEISEKQCAVLEKEIEALQSQKNAKQDEIEQAKSRRGNQEALRQRHAQLEAEKCVISSKNKVLQDELEEINRKTDPQSSVKLTSELQIEIVGLQRETGDLEESIKQGRSKLASMKQNCLELGGVRNGLREEKETLQAKLTLLSDKQEPETVKEMCLAKADIEKEIEALKSDKNALQDKIEHAKSRQESQHDLREHFAELEAEKRSIFYINKMLQSELEEINSESDSQHSVKLYSELQIEVAGMRRERGVLQEQIKQGKSKLEQQANMKHNCLELEGVRDGLREEKDALKAELALLSYKQELETNVAKANDIEKEIEALKSQKNALQNKIEHAKSRQESQHDLREHFAKLEAEKRSIFNINKKLQDKLEEINRKCDPQRSIKLSSELQIEVAGLRRETGRLQEQIKQAESKLEQQAAMKQNCLEWEGVRKGLREEKEALQDKLTLLSEKLDPEICAELCVERANDIEQEIAALRSHTSVLQGEMEHGKAKLQQQTSLKERCVELQAESCHVQDENESILREISQLLGKLAREKSWKHQLNATRVLMRTLESEKEQLLKHKQKLEKELDVQKIGAFEYKMQIQNLTKLRSETHHLQQDVSRLVTEIRNQKSAQENCKDMAKEDAQVEAKNKQLRKNVEKLKKELEKLGPVEMEHENFTHGLDKLREENCDLHNEIRTLNEEMASKKMLQARLKSLKAEQEWRLQRRHGLQSEISWLKGVRWEQLPLREEKKEGDEKNERLHQQNMQLRRNLEKLFVETSSKEIDQILTSSAKTQSEEMDRLNQQLAEEIEEFGTSV